METLLKMSRAFCGFFSFLIKVSAVSWEMNLGFLGGVSMGLISGGSGVVFEVGLRN